MVPECVPRQTVVVVGVRQAMIADIAVSAEALDPRGFGSASDYVGHV